MNAYVRFIYDLRRDEHLPRVLRTIRLAVRGWPKRISDQQSHLLHYPLWLCSFPSLQLPAFLPSVPFLIFAPPPLPWTLLFRPAVAAFRKTLSALKIYSIRNVNYRFLVLTMNFGTQPVPPRSSTHSATLAVCYGTPFHPKSKRRIRWNYSGVFSSIICGGEGRVILNCHALRRDFRFYNPFQTSFILDLFLVRLFFCFI